MASTHIDGLIEAARSGFASLSIDQSKRDSALENLGDWLRRDEFAEYRDAIGALIEAKQWDLLLYNFFCTMPFGTGGRRGPVGFGPNCFNPVTLATSVEGHVRYLRQRFGDDAALRVVVAFDVRVFRDLKGRYADLSEVQLAALMGIRSRDFARVAAEVYAKRGVTVFMPDPEGEWILSTPELSFAIRALGAHGGLNVSASHNHPDDSGGKFYEHRGGQEVPPYDEEFSALVESVDRAERMPFQDALQSGLVQFLDRALHDQYVQANVDLSMFPSERSARVVFTNLHGAGDTNVGEVLERAGFEVHYVESQRSHDGQFPNVPFRIANPEVPESMIEAADLAKRLGADLVLSTDPDADRIGLMVPNPDAPEQWVFVNGNEIGALVTAHRFDALAERGELPKRPIFVTTEVTSRLPVALAALHGARSITSLLVGCKYIANVMAHLEDEGRFGEVDGTLDDYVIGLEESHGVMVSPTVRDKDAAGAAILLAERASLEVSAGRGLLDALYDAYRKVGVHVTSQVSIVIEGAVGMEQIARIQTGFRGLRAGDQLGGERIVSVDDFLDEGAHGPFVSGTDRSARNFLSFVLESGARVLCRPSGTEPKIKLYTERVGAPLGAGASRQQVVAERDKRSAELASITDAVAQKAYEFLGVAMPTYGLRVSPLLPLQQRSDFVGPFVQELSARAKADGSPHGRGPDALGNWVDGRIGHYGKDARGLVRYAVAEWLLDSGLDAETADRIRAVFSLV